MSRPELLARLLPKEPAAFNRRCAWLALAWLLATGLGSFIVSPKIADFGQYYMGGAMLVAGATDELYPIAIEGAQMNAGWARGSVMRPAYAQLAEERGVGDVNRFIQPPPMAVLYAPLALLEYRTAFWCWTILMILSMWATTLLAGRFHIASSGRVTRAAGLIVLLVAVSPLAYRTIRTSQISPLVALLGGLAVWEIMRGGGARGGGALLLGTLAKYSPAILAIPALIMKRWRLLVWGAVLSAGLFALSVVLTGLGPYATFLAEVAPTFRYGSTWRGNQSLHGFMQRLLGRGTLPAEFALLLRALAIALLIVIVGGTWRVRKNLIREPALLFAAAAALTAWWAISSPIFWEHYFVYLCPFWGWLVWDAQHGRARALVAGAVILLTWLPLTVVPGIAMPEPVASHMLIAAVLVVALATTRLVQQTSGPDQGR